MPNMPSITIVKSFVYRDVQEEFSNKYHFSGTVPTDAAGWKTLADAIIAAEKLTVGSDVTFRRAYGYVAGNNTSVAQIDYVALAAVVSGTAASLPATPVPGDIAATVRWLTPNVNTRGRKVYCRKYFHGVFHSGAPDKDKLDPGQRTLFGTYAAKLIDGTLPGSFKYCGPQGAVLSSPVVDQWLTTRTLKRRGKRPPP